MCIKDIGHGAHFFRSIRLLYVQIQLGTLQVTMSLFLFTYVAIALDTIHLRYFREPSKQSQPPHKGGGFGFSQCTFLSTPSLVGTLFYPHFSVFGAWWRGDLTPTWLLNRPVLCSLWRILSLFSWLMRHFLLY